MHNAQNNNKVAAVLATVEIITPLGGMIAIADEHVLYLLEFVDHPALKRKIARICNDMTTTIHPSTTAPITSIENELKAYFDGTLQEFATPLFCIGTNFQKNVWTALLRIPYGQTQSYAQQAQAIEKPTASRAVANANGANQIAIVIPCHRIINSNGNLGGYGSGIARKQWLLNHERQNKS